MNWPQIWSSRKLPDVAFRLLLLPLSLIYGAGWQAYKLIYRLGLKKAYHAKKVFVICCGNLRVGGTGKTPFVIYLINLLKTSGTIVLSCSGYGGKKSQGASLAPLGDLDPDIWGDEPALLRRLLPDTPLIVGRDRVAGAKIAEEEFPGCILILDDGAQHLPLAKDKLIILEPAAHGSKLCLPAGPYREPRFNRKFADILIGQGGLKLSREPLQIPGFKKGKVQVLCAIGDPERFIAEIIQQGGEIVKQVILPDHDNLKSSLLFEEFDKSYPVIMTLKDWVKAQKRDDLEDFKILVANYEVKVLDEDELLKKLNLVDRTGLEPVTR